MLNDSFEVIIYPGKVVSGTVIDKDMDGVIVSFGYRHDGYITYAEWDPYVASAELKRTIGIGDEVNAKVLRGNTKGDFVRLSKYKADIDAAWQKVAELPEGKKRSAMVKVLSIVENKDKNIVGLGVAVEGVEGFMPASHVNLYRVDNLSGYIGKELEAEIIEVDKDKKRFALVNKK